ncbi:MAG TPA: Lrp/AsnC family transcriptional regulator [Actinomycetota bacterium]|nr:Lrp/AsnC family transcriptional regulator [Actinomycetota bacterium]
MAGTTPAVDAIDLRILEMLQEDGRRSYTAIAGELGVSEANVRQRTKRMIGRGVAQIVAVADPISLGFGIMAAMNIRTRGGNRPEIADQIGAFAEVSYLALCAGSADMLAEVVCRDQEHLLQITEAIEKIPGVEVIETFMYLRVVKQSEQWLTSGGARLLDRA